MNCFNHDKVPAVAVCKQCGRAMCYDCAMVSGKYDGICPECKAEYYNGVRRKNRAKIAKATVFTAILCAVLATLGIMLLHIDMILCIGVAAGVTVVVFLLALLFNITKGGSTYKKIKEIIAPPPKKKTSATLTVNEDKGDINSGRMEVVEPSATPNASSTSSASTKGADTDELFKNMP